jgi:hypothetical protein
MELPGRLSNRKPLGSKVESLLEVKLGTGTANVNTLQASTFLTSSTSGCDLTPFLLGHPREDADEQLTDGAAHVEPGFPHGQDGDAEPVAHGGTRAGAAGRPP